MNRDEYIRIKESTPMELVWIYYKEHSDTLTKGELYMYLNSYDNINTILNTVISRYDKKFDITVVLTADGKYIKSI